MPGGVLASAYHLTRKDSSVEQQEKVCKKMSLPPKVFATQLYMTESVKI